MRMTKYDLMTEIMLLWDERDSLMRHVQELEGRTDKQRSLVDQVFIKIGREVVLDEHTYGFRLVNAKRVDGMAEFMTYKTFLDEVIKEVPSWCSKDEFKAVFAEELTARYERERAEAIAYLEDMEEDDE